MTVKIAAIPQMAVELSQKLMNSLTASTRRKQFFTLLSQLLRAHIPFDRLCINLYQQEEGMLMYFTAVEGTIVSSLSPVRPAEVSSTVAGKVIATRRPVIITDFSQHFPGGIIHPIAEAGLTSTIAFPLILDNEIIATLHCSFAKAPEKLYEMTAFLLALSPVVATCIGAILSLEHVRARSSLEFQPLAVSADDDIICHSPAMREVMRTLDAVAPLNIPVLLLGETGTGKSLIAQAIHRRSRRKEANFVKVNCPSLPETLFESELFGHAKGSFTGAVSKRVGRFELAHNGTLFLDEIAELSPEMQSKLLQVLEDSSFERVGESVSLAVDVRIIAATNVRLGEALERQALRADLLYRLSPCAVELPSLRERREDIPPLISSLAAQVSSSLGLPNSIFKPAVIAPMLHYSWPGNIRELRNVLSKLLVLRSVGHSITAATVEKILEDNLRMVVAASPTQKPEKKITAESHDSVSLSSSESPLTMAEMEKRHILDVLRRTGGTIAGPKGAATLLALPRGTLQHRMQKLGIVGKKVRNGDI